MEINELKRSVILNFLGGIMSVGLAAYYIGSRIFFIQSYPYNVQANPILLTLFQAILSSSMIFLEFGMVALVGANIQRKKDLKKGTIICLIAGLILTSYVFTGFPLSSNYFAVAPGILILAGSLLGYILYNKQGITRNPPD